ncbi:MAG: hypothetical protein UD936_10060 [Acutalibacteraceae bacterium]|nr:hypothetical protein [Acutalibacteraceae bacterium]
MTKMSITKKGVAIIVAVAIMLTTVVITNIFSSDEITNDVTKMVENAEKLHANGDFKNAFYQLQLYCQENSHDSKAWMLLGDFSLEQSDAESAYAYYQKAAGLVQCDENQIGEADRIKTFKNFSAVNGIRIYPAAKYTKGMKLSFSGENLTPVESVTGRPLGNSGEMDNDENYLTTEWFDVDDSRGSMYITGNINCAEWQFLDSNGYYTKYDDKGNYRQLESVSFSSKAYSSVKIPKNTVKARVTYYDKSIYTNVVSKDKIFVGYGSGLTGYTAAKSQSFEIPDLSENQYVEYRGDEWIFFDGNDKTKLDLEPVEASQVAIASVSGELCGMVDFNLENTTVKHADKTLKYGIRFNTKSGVASCERLANAKGMNFDYMVDGQWSVGTGNDFDTAYPWCDMKLCNVSVDAKGKEKITLEDEAGFKTDGTNGNVMVRIPKFYSKRIVQNGYEYIWISGTKHKGYSIEPVFVKEDGKIADYVYMSAYVGSNKNNKLVSVAGSYPVIWLEYGDTLKFAENNGKGFTEINYLMCSALQKLFIIETGTIDSSSVFAGETHMYYYYDTTVYDESGYAAESAKKSNKIRIYNNFNTTKITEGSSIAIIDGWNKYTQKSKIQHEVISVEKSEEFIDITFDGDPVNITKHKTIISNIPSKTGKTDSIDYCTGTFGNNDGKTTFKYRNIENLYGSTLFMLDDDSYVQDGYYYYTAGDGELKKVNAPVAQQERHLTTYDYANTDMCIKSMIYDSKNPLIMLPSTVGKGANAYNYYGDIWMYNNKKDGTKAYLLYGSANDNERLGGVFQTRAIITDYKTSLDFYSGRIMYK